MNLSGYFPENIDKFLKIRNVDIKKALIILKAGASAVMSQTQLNYNSSQITYDSKKFLPLNEKNLKIFITQISF